MAKVFIEESTLTNIGNAIRSKTGKTALIDPALMGAEIEGIISGGSGGGELEIPQENLVLTGAQTYIFYKTGWNWYLDKFGKYMSTNELSSANYMFSDNTTIKNIPFEINFKPNVCYADHLFSGCTELKTAPKINISGTFTTSFTVHNLFYMCSTLKNVDNVFDPEALEAGLSGLVASGSSSNVPKWGSLLYGCRSLTTLPPWFYKLKFSSESTMYPSSSYSLYGNTFCNCSSLGEAMNLPVINCNANATSNLFATNTFKDCYRLKGVTFELNNGEPFVVRWKSQTIDLSQNVGYGSPAGYNSDFTEDLRVKDAETYQALKDNPNWFTSTSAYCRYNHDSAVATINSLPDTSAYLAEAGGTNTIKFKGAPGASTDGGAVNTLTAEEIAVATAKGWTVTLV